MKALALIAVLLSVAILSGCTMAVAPVMAPLVIDQKGPVAGFDTNAASDRVGRAKAQGIIFVGYGDASISAAAANGNIVKIHHVDSESLSILGVYSKYETIVYGE